LEPTLRAERKRGNAAPELDRKPELAEGARQYWNAFSRISRSRHFGDAGPAAIACTEIGAWLDLHGVLEQEERETYCDMIEAMDERLLEWSAKKAAS